MPGQPLPDSWACCLDEKKSAGSFMLIDSVRDQLGAALKFQGHSVNSISTAELKAARDLCIAAKARCVGFDGSVGVKNKVLGKTAKVGICYSGEGVRAMSGAALGQDVSPVRCSTASISCAATWTGL